MIQRIVRLLAGEKSTDSIRRKVALFVFSASILGASVLMLRDLSPAPPSPTLYPITWGGYDGICLKQDKKTSTETYSFLTRSGKVILMPLYTFWQGKLVYLSEDDRALCFVSTKGKPHWLTIGNRIPERKGDYLFPFRGLSPTQNGIFFNMGTNERMGSYYLEVETDTISLVPDAADVRGTDGFTTYAYADWAGKFHLRTASGESDLIGVTLPLDNGDAAWDYSAKNDTFCFSFGTKVTVIHSGESRNWRLPDYHGALGVFIEPTNDRLWFHIRRTFNNGSYLISTDRAGKRDKAVVTSSDLFYNPILLPDRQTIELIRRLPVEQ